MLLTVAPFRCGNVGLNLAPAHLAQLDRSQPERGVGLDTDQTPTPSPGQYCPKVKPTRPARMAHPLRNDELQQCDLWRSGTKEAVVRGETLASQGTPCTSLFLLLDGALKAVCRAEHGREAHLVEIYRPEDSLYESALFLPAGYPVTIIACCDSQVLRIPSQDVLSHAANNPAFAAYVFARLAAQQRGLLRHLVVHVSYNAEQRLANFLLDFAAHESTSTKNFATLSRRDIASYLGLTPETLSRTIAVFRDRGLIEATRQRIEIRDQLGLQAVMHSPK